MRYARRDLLKLALGALPGAYWLPKLSFLQDRKPDSLIEGVQVGIIAPYAFRGAAQTPEVILEALLDLGISAVEMQFPAVESYAGAPVAPRGQRGGSRGDRQRARQQHTEQLAAWRSAASMDKAKEIRQMYEAAGVDIYAFKLDLPSSMSDAEVDYAFQTAKALGASHMTMELHDEITERVGSFAKKHGIPVAYHNHMQVDESSWDRAMQQSDHNRINLDVGHFTAAISKSPIPFIEKYHDRILSMHFKDRKYGSAGATNMPWGEGDTPLREVLQLMKREGYTFPATIELEYRVPDGSSVMGELRRCLQFCKDALAPTDR